MASRIQDSLTQVGTHSVGNLNSLKVKTVANGATVAGAAIDNFTLGSLGFDAEGNRTVTQLAAVADKAVLVAAPETRYLGESMADFYNAVGEKVRCVILEAGYTRFDTSAYTATGDPANGDFAHFDPATKKFLVHDGTHLDYAGASAKFLVVNFEGNIEYTTGQKMVRLEVIEA